MWSKLNIIIRENNKTSKEWLQREGKMNNGVKKKAAR